MINLPNLTILTLNKPGITDFAQARNDLLSQATTEWVLFLDADETLSPDLEQELTALLSATASFDAYQVPRRDIFLNRRLRHGETGSTKLLRLAKKSWGQWQRPVHEVWVGKGRVGQLNSPIIHRPHNLSQFVAKIDQYSTLDANYRYNLKVRASLFNVIVYPIAKFKYNYFIKLGFLDGVEGLIHAIMMSWHSYLTWTKLYLLWHQK